MLPSINLLYLGCTVLILMDLSYLSRFWTQFEAWLSMQTATTGGLRAAPEDKRRCHVRCLHQAPPMFAEHLYSTWSTRTPEEAHKYLQSPDVTVTNASDKVTQLEKLGALDAQVKEAACSLQCSLTLRIAVPLALSGCAVTRQDFDSQTHRLLDFFRNHFSRELLKKLHEHTAPSLQEPIIALPPQVRVVTGRPVLVRCQDLPPEAFVSAEEAAILYGSQERKVLALTSGWLSGFHPDPDGATFDLVRAALQAPLPGTGGEAVTIGGGRGLFWDFCCLCMKDHNGNRSEEESQSFGQAFREMGRVFASPCGVTSLVVSNDVPSPPAMFDGLVTVILTGGGPQDNAAVESLLDAVLSHASREAVVGWQLAHGRQLLIRFARQADAKQFLSEVRDPSNKLEGEAFLTYNDRPLRLRGWSVFEIGVARVAEAFVLGLQKQQLVRFRTAGGLTLFLDEDCENLLVRNMPKVIDIGHAGNSVHTPLADGPLARMVDEALQNALDSVQDDAVFFLGGGTSDTRRQVQRMITDYCVQLEKIILDIARRERELERREMERVLERVR